MSSFRCPNYVWNGNWYCLVIKEYITSYDFDTYCSDENRCGDCPYHRY